jgi:predicted Zn-dependent protease
MRSRLIASLLICLCIQLAGAQTRAWLGTITLPTSDEGAPDENPPYDLFSNAQINYPYTMREAVRPTETAQAWRAIFLENEYLKCSVLPDLGGHIYTCIDKVNGQPMFYANPSIKKALIGYRGAWAAFGQEFNFPVSHNWVSLSPVDFAFGNDPDGSAWVTVGNRDRVYGMEWTVRIALRPGESVVQENVTLANRSDLRRRYYWWSNAGIQVWDDSQICYPMQFTASHGFKDIDTWPVDSSGRNLSIIANQTGGNVSRFAYASREPFMGVYHPHTDAGVVHYSAYSELPHKKIWSWGVDSGGINWRDVLSDNKSAYVEVQGGLFRNQETYEWMEPGEQVRFTEYWMPVRQTGTITYANLNGVLGMRRLHWLDGKSTLAVGLNVTHRVEGARIAVIEDDKIILSTQQTLDPSMTWKRQIEIRPGERKYSFELSDAQGVSLLRFTEGSYDWTPRDQVKVGPIPETGKLDRAKWTDSDYVAHGEEQELNGLGVRAGETYAQGLKLYPTSLKLQKAAGRLYMQLLRYQEAEQLLSKAEAQAADDAETHYYRGIAIEGLGNEAEAHKEFEAAGSDAKFRKAGGLLAAELKARQNDVAGALETLESACGVVANARCAEEHVALLRAAGRAEEARKLAEDSLKSSPTSSFLRNELVKLGGVDEALDRHLGAESNRVLDLQLEYVQLGMCNDAAELAVRKYPRAAGGESEPGAIAPGDDPLVAYVRAWCLEKMGQPSRQAYAAAASMGLKFVFPNDPGLWPVLKAAIAANGRDGSAHFLLGELEFSRGQVDAALAEWKKSEKLKPDIPALHASWGKALAEFRHQPKEARKVYERGIAVDPLNPELYVGLDKLMKAGGEDPQKRVAMLKRYPQQTALPATVLRALVNALRENRKDKEADTLIKSQFVPRKEGEAPLQTTRQ